MIRCEEGVNTRERIAVTGDALNITERIKEIDPDYFIMFNRVTQRFEVHMRSFEYNTLGCEIPYDTLDARTIAYVREHHSSRIGAILKEMEAEEARAERERAREMQELKERLNDGLAYAAKSRTTDEFPDEAAEGLRDDAQRDVQYGGRVHRQERRLCNHHGHRR